VSVTVGRFGAPILVFLAWIAACSDNTGPRPPEVDSLPTIAGLAVSAPVPGAAALGGGAQASVAATSVDESVVYVSLAPGSVPTGRQATIRDVATGQSTTAEVVHGGFDPVAIPASIGDTLIVEVSGTSADVLRAMEVVAKRRPPAVVRTDPPPKKRDVPLNATIVIVFSTPIDPATVGTGSVTLLRGTTPVAGTVRFADVAHLRAEFHPDALLAAQSDYELVLSQGIRGVNGLALDAAVTVPFTTGTTAPSTPVEAVGALQKVEVTTVTTGGRVDPDGYGVLNDEWDYDIGDGVTVPVPTNGAVTLYLRPGAHVLHLVGVAANCSGENLDDRAVTVSPGAVTSVAFYVVCKEPESVNLLLRVRRTP
jgi:Big-like domain-containing protein